MIPWKDSDIENRLAAAKGEGGGGGKDWEFGISRCKLFIHRLDKQQDPTVEHRELYSICWDKPYSFPFIMEKNIKKNVYTCITESLCCTAEINTTLYINYASIKNKLKKRYPGNIY